MRLFLLFLLINTNTMADTNIPLQIKPSHLYSQLQQHHQLQLTGGLLPIHAQTNAGQITPTDDAHVFNYQAPQRYMQDEITFYDRADQEAVLIVDILRPLSGSPQIREIKPQQQTHFTIQGGSGDWSVVQTSDLITVKSTKNKLTVTANDKTGTQEIVIQDTKTQEKINLTIEIYAPLALK